MHGVNVDKCMLLLSLESQCVIICNFLINNYLDNAVIWDLMVTMQTDRKLMNDKLLTG